MLPLENSEPISRVEKARKLVIEYIDILQNFFNNIQQAVLDRLSLALELPPEGGVAQYLLVAPEFVHGYLLQLSRVMSACGGQNIELYREKNYEFYLQQ